MKPTTVNLETKIQISFANPKFRMEDLAKITEAWSVGDYRIWFEMYVDLFENPYIEISASRSINHDGVNITKRWMEVCKHLEQDDIPDWLVEKAINIK